MFQMQYGLIPKMRYEFMYLMTKYALLGLEYEGHPGLPEPTNLKTADRRWIEETMPQSKTGEGGWCTTLRPVPVPTLPIPTS